MGIDWRTPSRFCKRPVVVEAMKYTGNNGHDIERWSGRKTYQSPVLEPTKDNPTGSYMQIDTLEGTMTCIVGDYIIRGIQGEYYPCKFEIFMRTYDEVPPNAGEKGEQDGK